jgi:hypothetical protein
MLKRARISVLVLWLAVMIVPGIVFGRAGGGQSYSGSSSSGGGYSGSSSSSRSYDHDYSSSSSSSSSSSYSTSRPEKGYSSYHKVERFQAELTVMANGSLAVSETIVFTLGKQEAAVARKLVTDFSYPVVSNLRASNNIERVSFVDDEIVARFHEKTSGSVTVKLEYTVENGLLPFQQRPMLGYDPLFYYGAESATITFSSGPGWPEVICTAGAGHRIQAPALPMKSSLPQRLAPVSVIPGRGNLMEGMHILSPSLLQCRLIRCATPVYVTRTARLFPMRFR